MSDSNKLVILVSKLIEKTIEKKLEWIISRPNDIDNEKYPNDIIEVVYYSNKEGYYLHLFERKYRLVPLQGRVSIYPQRNSNDWVSSIELNFYNREDIPVLEISNISILKDLLKVVKEQVSDLDIDKLIQGFDSL